MGIEKYMYILLFFRETFPEYVNENQNDAGK